MGLLSQLKEKARHLKSEMQVLMIAYKDKRTPATSKILIAITVGYLLSPIDLIPDFIPVLGLLDDLIIVPVLISVSLKHIPPVVLSDARDSVKNNYEFKKKNNWFIALLIILIWILLIYFLYQKLKYIWM
ncbi:MAG: DUF1232 domain-containing protein [Flavisolibacter sp.]|jgi:uncharacterized membrane protein YkvA (DUF1232 family)|nr:DUF1232 domain-containing protein [Flavisolibacter sp.]